MDEDLLTFRCVCGETGSLPELGNAPWADVVGYAAMSSVRWHPDAISAQADEPPITLLAQAPEVGQTCWLRLDMPFASQTGDSFWCLYDSPLAYFNGILEVPEEIAAMRLVNCRLESWQRDNADTVVGSVTVLNVVTLPQLRSGEPRQMRDDLFSTLMAGQFSAEHWQDYWLLDYNLEGDIGEWLLFTGSSRPTHLLLHCKWGQHEDYVWAGHGVLSDEVIGAVEARFAMAQE